MSYFLIQINFIVVYRTYRTVKAIIIEIMWLQDSNKWSENAKTWVRTNVLCYERKFTEMKMEGAVLSVSTNNNRFRTHLKNAASAICARTLPKQRRNETTTANSSRHHTYPRASPPKRASIPCRIEPLLCVAVPNPAPTQHENFFEIPAPIKHEITAPNAPNGTTKLRGTLAR